MGCLVQGACNRHSLTRLPWIPCPAPPPSPRCELRCTSPQTRVKDILGGIVGAYKDQAPPGVQLTYTYTSSVDRPVLLDPLRIRQLLVNGVTNALKYTASGSVRLHVRTAEEHLSGASTVCACVSAVCQQPWLLLLPFFASETPAVPRCCCFVIDCEFPLGSSVCVEHVRCAPVQASEVCMPNDAPGVLFQVIDTGPGLCGRDFKRLFDPLLEIGEIFSGHIRGCRALHKRTNGTIPVTWALHCGCRLVTV